MTEQKSGGLLASFPATFWIANVMELFERAAYYGMNSVLAIYLTDSVARGGLGFAKESAGLLQSLIYALTYVVPIVGGALADRYGYRRMLMVAFSLLATGYFVTGHMSAYGMVFTSLLVMATGSGLFKPIITGTVARTTTEANSGFGFGLYYWCINLGAFLAPLVVSYLKGFAWSYVFTASAIYCALMLLPAIFVFRDPPKPASTKTIGEVLAGAAMVLGDARFMLMIFVYSGFWILYFQNFGTVLWFLRDFVDKAPVNAFFASLGINFSFDSEHVTVINAGTIILLQVVVSRVVKNLKPLPTMIGGLVIGALGFVCLAYAFNAWIFVLGIAVFSIGEMTAHPKYYSYVGLVAPPDRKAVYMGYAFLYGVIGSLVGVNVGAAMYTSMLEPLVGQTGIEASLRNFWLIFAALGIVAVVGLLLYNRFFSVDSPESNSRARLVMIAVYGLVVLLGAYYFYTAAFGPTMAYRTLVQAVIMLALGGGGLMVSFRRA